MKANVIRSCVYSLLWIVAGFALFFSALWLELSVNFFSWNPDLDGETAAGLAGVITVEILIFILTSKTRTIAAHITALIVCLALVAFGAGLYMEHLKETIETANSVPGLFISRRTLSPTWYRLVHLVLYLIPLYWWGYYLFRRLTNSRRITPDDRPEFLTTDGEIK